MRTAKKTGYAMTPSTTPVVKKRRELGKGYSRPPQGRCGPEVLPMHWITGAHSETSTTAVRRQSAPSPPTCIPSIMYIAIF